MFSSGQSAEPSPISARIKAVCDRLFDTAQPARYGLNPDSFRMVLLDVLNQNLADGTEHEQIRFLESLRTEELALARGCVAGNEFAWQTFLSRYRSSLYGAAYSIAKQESIARDLADSLYAELYGLPNDSGRRVSKLQYYKGRGSLEGWLRTVVAQEFVKRYRRTRREVSLEEKIDAGEQFPASASNAGAETADPRLAEAVDTVLQALDAETRFLLNAYYLDRRTLAEIGRVLGVHESTISRKLERATQALRKSVLKQLIARGLSARQADEWMRDIDVRDLNINIRDHLQQESEPNAFYKETGE